MFYIPTGAPQLPFYWLSIGNLLTLKRHRYDIWPIRILCDHSAGAYKQSMKAVHSIFFSSSLRPRFLRLATAHSVHFRSFARSSILEENNYCSQSRYMILQMPYLDLTPKIFTAGISCNATAYSAQTLPYFKHKIIVPPCEMVACTSNGFGLHGIIHGAL